MTATSMLVWTDTDTALYVRRPSANPAMPLGGRLLGYARQLADDCWQVILCNGSVRVEKVVDSRHEAELLLGGVS